MSVCLRRRSDEWSKPPSSPATREAVLPAPVPAHLLKVTVEARLSERRPRDDSLPHARSRSRSVSSPEVRQKANVSWKVAEQAQINASVTGTGARQRGFLCLTAASELRAARANISVETHLHKDEKQQNGRVRGSQQLLRL